ALGVDDWDVIERNVGEYVTAPSTKAFHVASTLRQFTEIWDLEKRDDRGRALVDILRARLMELGGGSVEITPEKLQRLRQQTPPEKAQLEAVLGREGPQTYQWWKTGLDRALSVASIRQRLSGRVGTAFLLRARQLGPEAADARLLLPHFHLVNEHGGRRRVQPGD